MSRNGLAAARAHLRSMDHEPWGTARICLPALTMGLAELEWRSRTRTRSVVMMVRRGQDRCTAWRRHRWWLRRGSAATVDSGSRQIKWRSGPGPDGGTDSRSTRDGLPSRSVEDCCAMVLPIETSSPVPRRRQRIGSMRSATAIASTNARLHPRHTKPCFAVCSTVPHSGHRGCCASSNVSTHATLCRTIATREHYRPQRVVLNAHAGTAPAPPRPWGERTRSVTCAGSSCARASALPAACWVRSRKGIVRIPKSPTCK